MLAVAFMLTGAGISTVPPMQQIVSLEQHRSLGTQGELGKFLNDPDERIAARAALAIGRTKRAAGAVLLTAHLRDTRTAVRAMAVYGLGLLADPSKTPTILTLAGSDPSGAVRVAGIDALQRLEAANKFKPVSERHVYQVVATSLKADRDPIVRGRSAIALMSFADGAMGEPAAKALSDAIDTEREIDVRRRIMWTIFRRYAARVPQALLAKELRDPDEVVRIEAVRAYGKLNDRKLIAVVQPLVNDPSWRVQEQALESIRVLQGNKLTEHLTAIPAGVHVPPSQPDPFARVAALPRTAPAAKPSAPNASQAIYEPSIDPHTASDMTHPAKGPHPRVRVVTTKGNIYLTLYPEWAPLTVANFLNLANDGFYDDNPWFRIVPDFVVQTGEKDAKVAPGPGYSIGAEENPLEQSSYIISMGLNYDDKTQTPLRDSAGSEYYITLSPQFHLDLDFTVFGAVTSGFDVLGRLIESDKVVRIERLPDATI